ncbi:MAG: alpha-L-rhamnosidase [Planctomycetes bacterium]|nr:alpha-L-rhamnosidase [Planctomycetota bacterium]
MQDNTPNLTDDIPGDTLDLSPAQWLWYPGDRTLPNTFVLFRRVLHLTEKPRRATGWIIGDSRYLLEVNGRRIQWGPAPNDPRWPEVDPMDLTEALTTGENVIGATVLHFGQGDSTHPMGRAGFIFKLEIEHADGRHETVVSDTSWRCHLSRAWQPGHHRMWYMRALQEEFDARQHPQGWTQPGFVEDADWLEPQLPPCPAHLPIFCDPTIDVMLHIHGPRKFIYGAEARSKMELRPRSIPLMRETWVGIAELAEQHRIRWKRPIAEYFAVRPPNAYAAEPTQAVQPIGDGVWRVELDPERGTTLTFALPEQMVGWPSVTIDAPAGTTLELMTQDAHLVGGHSSHEDKVSDWDLSTQKGSLASGPVLLNTTHHKWARFTCREGVNTFQWFDFDCLRWMQVHLHPGRGSVVVSRVGILKREYPWPHEPRVLTSEAPLQRVFDAATNTMRNAAQETFVDGMSRERNQYSGGISLCRHAIHMLAGENRQVAHFLRSFSQGSTPEGYFMDCWPSHDRLNRLGQRVLEATHCGALLDAGVRFAFDCWEYYLYSGDLAPLREPYPRLLRLVSYLREKMNPDDLLPVDQEDYGFPIVYVGFSGCFPNQRDRQCAFNLFWAASLSQAMAPMCRAFGDAKLATELDQLGQRVLQATVARFWSQEHGAFVDNLPWWREDGDVHYSEMTLGIAVELDQCPGGSIQRSVELLATLPKNLGIDNSTEPVAWRLWALVKGGRADAVLKELREVWATMPSIVQNNAIAEFYQGMKPDTGSNWSHACCAPIYVAAMSLAGIRPLAPGFARYEISPQLADLPDLALTVHTPHGPIGFSGRGLQGARVLDLSLPPDVNGELVVHRAEQLPLKRLGEGRFALPAGRKLSIDLKHT